MELPLLRISGHQHCPRGDVIGKVGNNRHPRAADMPQRCLVVPSIPMRSVANEQGLMAFSGHVPGCGDSVGLWTNAAQRQHGSLARQHGHFGEPCFSESCRSFGDVFVAQQVQSC
jgi:hypothetical protein